MPLYDLDCANCGRIETFARMGFEDALPCPVCERERPKAIVLPQFQEDRTRMWRGPLGNGYSTALGERMPDSRSKRDRLAKEKGVEFVSKAEHLSENKEAAEAVAYARHVQEGGARIERPAPTLAPFVPKPDWAKALGV